MRTPLTRAELISQTNPYSIEADREYFTVGYILKQDVSQQSLNEACDLLGLYPIKGNGKVMYQRSVLIKASLLEAQVIANKHFGVAAEDDDKNIEGEYWSACNYGINGEKE